MPDQPALFQDAPPPHAWREEFLAGMLATWLLDGKKPNPTQREELAKIVGRAMRDAEMVVALHA